ncbi:MAG: putative bicarbonate transporter, ICT family protein [Microgenomates group bacterium GW2011_GWA2_40_6]|nr:MAG: putative bicarbonate transporter, ICT family protein [Microgenomates group bacterium GW2011_GWA2_40_6]
MWLFLFLLAIPTQLGRHFWPEWSQVIGMRVDYLSPTLYLVDIFWTIWITGKYRYFNFKKLVNFENLIFLLLIGVNVIVAGNRWVAIYRWVRIIQWIVTIKLIKNEELRIKNYLKWILPIWVITESLLGLTQVLNGGSIGGIWYWIGERRFSFSSIGIAQMSLFGEGLLRAYGSFSHPNSSAGFLLIVWCYWQRNKNKNFNYWIVYWIAILGILVSGSRWVWGITFIIFNLKFLIFKNKLRVKDILGRCLVMVGLASVVLGMISVNYRLSDFFAGWDSDSLNKRKTLFVAGIKMVKENPLLGIGAGNFVVKLPQFQKSNNFFWLQPVHNMFLLAWVEIGLLGIMAIGYKLVKCLEYPKLIKNKKNWVILGLIVMTGMVDHYWLTLPQNSWLLAVILGII